jgi:hypothetical protein
MYNFYVERFSIQGRLKNSKFQIREISDVFLIDESNSN